MKLLQLGCGVVGGAYLRAFHEDGTHAITGADISEARVQELRARGYECATVAALEGTFDAILVSVPTPLGDDRKLSMRFVDACVDTCAAHLRGDGVVLIRSTVTPGYCADFERRLRARGHASARVAFSPEYLRAHAAADDARNPPLVVIGSDDARATRAIREIFAPFTRDCDVVVLGRSEAELQKLVHNHYNALKISYGNAVAAVARHLDPEIDPTRVLRVVAKTAESVTNPYYGFRKVNAPFNGTCLTKDPQHLASLCKADTAERDLLQSAVDMNEALRGTTYDTDYAGGYADSGGARLQSA